MAEGWTVYVDDNFHHMDEDERYCHGTFESYSAALAACQMIVDGFLEGSPATTADDLYQQYISFGEDPWITGPTLPAAEPAFSAWDYARQRCDELRP